MNESDDLWWLRPDGKTQVIYKADSEQDEARRRSQWTGTCPRYDNQRRVAPNDREDVREARQGEDHHHSASTTQTVERKHEEKSNKMRIITTEGVRRFPGSLTSPKHESGVDPAVRQAKPTITVRVKDLIIKSERLDHHGKNERLDHQ